MAQLRLPGQVSTCHWVMAHGVDRHENRGSQQHHRLVMMGRQAVAGGKRRCQWTTALDLYPHGDEADVTDGHLCG